MGESRNSQKDSEIGAVRARELITARKGLVERPYGVVGLRLH